MHEYSVVQSLLDLCEENAKQNNCLVVSKVIVKIGVMSGVEPELLKTAFDTFKEKTICENAEFVMNIQEVVVSCGDCKNEAQLLERNYSCPKCGSQNLQIIDGEDAYLMSLEME